MMMILRDDAVIEVFDEPSQPPDWIEGIDVENEEYQFCDDAGQRYVGEIIRPLGLFRQAKWQLLPEGIPDSKNALELIAKAKAIEPNDTFPDLEALKRHINVHTDPAHGVHHVDIRRRGGFAERSHPLGGL